MPDLDAELLERVARWCADAGRTTAPAEIRSALAPLGWDELLAVRALLAGPPPARPLGPYALADLGRGAPPDVAAEREREGRYPSLADADAPAAPAASAPAPAPGPAPARRATGRRARVTGPVIRRARDVVVPAPPPARAAPLLEELFLPEGRTVLERLVRRHGARRPALVAELASWRAADGNAPGEADLSRLLEHHGLARGFARRERDELLHALRASGGLRSAAAARLGVDPEALDAALARVGATTEAERIREARRDELRARATLAGRTRLLLTEAPRLEDLGILREIEEDLGERLPEHLRALGATGEPLLLALARSLSITPTEARALADRFTLSMDAPRASGGGRPRGASPSRQRPPRPGSARPGSARPGSARPGSARPGSARPGSARPGSARPGSARPGSARPGSARPGSARPGSQRPGSSRPAPGRPGATRSAPGRPGSPRPGPGRPDFKRPGSPRPKGARPPPRGGPRRG